MQDDEYIEVQDPEKYKQFKFLENIKHCKQTAQILQNQTILVNS